MLHTFTEVLMLSHTLVAFPTNYKQKIKMMEKKKRKKERAIAYAMHKQKTKKDHCRSEFYIDDYASL